MSSALKLVSPVDGRVYAERPLADATTLEGALVRAVTAQTRWRQVPVEERAAYCSRFVDALLAKADEILPELSWQMGRPLSQAGGELRGFEERARYMIEIAPQALEPMPAGPKPGFERFVRRESLGIVLTIPAWNYPYMIAVNTVVPAIMAGNCLILKHSSQTALCAERFAQAFAAAGLPEGVFQYLHMDHELSARAVMDSRVSHVAFTGSLRGGQAIEEAALGHFMGVGIELGGKDPAYVRADADLPQVVENLVDGAFFNAGQSCCSIERIYVEKSVYEDFVECFVSRAKEYRLGDPLDPATTLGPLVRESAAQFVREQIAEAVSQGARALIDPAEFPADRPGSPYLAPQVLVDVNHQMRVMSEETFGPVVGIMSVNCDEEALALMNDSDYGLTASLWTADRDFALALAERLQTGTVFMNRCDYLDPALAWVGVKHSGRGCTLSRVGYEHLTRPKSFHFRLQL